MDAVLAMLVPMLLGTGGAIWSAMQWRRARAFEDTPTSRVRSAAQGYVELTGVARALPGDPTLSPLTGRLCVWYKYTVEERSSSSSREEWRTVDSGTSDETFAIEDATGQATINPEGADVTALDKDVWHGDTPRTPPALRPWRVFGGIGSRYRYTEYLILDGQPIAAVGFFKTERAGDQPASLDTELALRLRDWKKDPQRMRRIDADRDGRISADEWEQARAAARDEIVKELREQSALPGWNVLQKPLDGRPFLLGTGTAKELVGRYRRSAWLLLAISVVLWGVGLHQA